MSPELCLDSALEGNYPNVGSYAELVARVAIHEIGHEFGLLDAAGPTALGWNTTMHYWVGTPTDAQFYFGAADIVTLRSRYQSPGS